MRRITLFVGLLGIALLASDATAEPAATAPSVPQPAPAGTLVRIVGFANLTTSFPYAGGPVDVAIDLENAGATPATVMVRISHGHGTTSMSKSVTLQPKSVTPRTTVKFTDAGGIDESCTPHTYSMSLEGPGVDTRTRFVSIVPTCTWSGSVEDGWASGPAEAEVARKTKAFVHTVVVDQGATCQTPAKLTANVGNHAPKPAAALNVVAMAGGVARGKSQPFALPVGGKVAAPFQVASGGSPPDVSIQLVDPSGAFSSEIASHPLFVKWKRGCRLSTTQIGP